MTQTELEPADREVSAGGALEPAVLDALGVAVYRTDRDGVITSYNHSATQLWGRSPKLGVDLWCGSWRILRPDGSLLPHDECPMAVCLREDRVVRGVEAIAERPDGSRVWFMPHPTPLHDDAGNLIGAVNVLVDITPQKQAEGALRESEAELRDFFENAAVALHWLGPDGTILRANRAEFDLLGYSKEEYLGRNIAEFHVDQAVIEDILQRLRHGEIVHGYEAALRCKDGSIKHVLIDSSVLWHDGEFLHTRCFSRDITARKLAEEENRRLAEEIRHNAEELQTLLDVAPVAIAVAHDSQGNDITLNPAGARMLGVDRADNASKSAPVGDRLPFKIFEHGEEVAPESLPM